MNRQELEKSYNQGERNFSSIDFSNAKLSNLNLSGANFKGANFSGADLSGANLSNINAENSEFYGTNLKRSNLSNANLQKALFDYSSLEEANLKKSVLLGADLRKSILYDANLCYAIYDSETQFPNAFDLAKSKTIKINNPNLDQKKVPNNLVKNTKIDEINKESITIEEKYFMAQLNHLKKFCYVEGTRFKVAAFLFAFAIALLGNRISGFMPPVPDYFFIIILSLCIPLFLKIKLKYVFVFPCILSATLLFMDYSEDGSSEFELISFANQKKLS